MRGYIAEWTLQDNHLVLKAICDCEGNRIDMNMFLPYLKKYIHNGQVREIVLRFSCLPEIQ